jgi:hypothetical protein|tara:strand:+ start:175 stop:1089 length:915 start_codon:yes stop_codon:yes gene_type:complete
MDDIIFHVGAPRTATTVLQKYVFSSSKRYFCLSKNPFEASGFVAKKASLANEYSREFVDSMLRDDVIGSEEKINFFKFAFGLLPLKMSTFPENKELGLMFKKALVRLSSSANAYEGALVSTERFIDTSASLNGDSKHKSKSDRSFPVYQVLRQAYEFGFSSRVLVVLRDPFEYLRSKYCRTCFQRRSSGSRHLSASEYIDKQCMLESKWPGTSALSVAMHASFVRSLGQFSYVKAIGFKDLVGSRDVFKLMGIHGETPINFADLPVENSFSLPALDSELLRREIKIALMRNNFYDRVMAQKLYD